MKHLLLLIILLFTETLTAQVIIDEANNSLDGELPNYKSDSTLTLYGPSKINCLIISWQIQNREQRKIFCSIKGLGECHKSNKLNFLLSDSSIISLNSDEKERCNDFSVFDFSFEQQERLEKSEVIHIEFENGSNSMKFETNLNEEQSKYFQRTLGIIKQGEDSKPFNFYNFMEIKGDTLQLHIKYVYNNRNIKGDEHGHDTIIKFFKNKKVKKHVLYSFPSDNISVITQRWTLWDVYGPFSIEGTIEIISLSKDKTEAKILVKDFGSLNITKETITFE